MSIVQKRPRALRFLIGGRKTPLKPQKRPKPLCFFKPSDRSLFLAKKWLLTASYELLQKLYLWPSVLQPEDSVTSTTTTAQPFSPPSAAASPGICCRGHFPHFSTSTPPAPISHSSKSSSPRLSALRNLKRYIYTSKNRYDNLVGVIVQSSYELDYFVFVIDIIFHL